MIEGKHLSKFLFIADMAVGCDICTKDTWNASDELSDDDIYVRQLWHDSDCPLRGREEVYKAFADLAQNPVNVYCGEAFSKKFKFGGRLAHSIWLKTSEAEYRIVAAHEQHAELDLFLLDHQPIKVLGQAHGEALYASMIITGDK